jgi:hypothetical protein
LTDAPKSDNQSANMAASYVISLDLRLETGVILFLKIKQFLIE